MEFCCYGTRLHRNLDQDEYAVTKKSGNIFKKSAIALDDRNEGTGKPIAIACPAFVLLLAPSDKVL